MNLLRISFICLCAFICASTQAAQAPEDAGPYAVGWRDLHFQDQHYGRRRVDVRLYYPANQAGKNKPISQSSLPLPLVAFQHGYLGKPEDYDLISEHLASWGFLVVATATQTGIFGKAPKLAKDAQAAMQWTEDRSNDASSWLFGSVRLGDWAAYGHSMGARSLPTLIDIEPRIRNFISLQPGDIDANESQHYNQYTGDVVFVGGDEDGVNPLAQNLEHYEEVTGAQRKLFFLIEGTGHFGATDGEQGSHSLPWTEQNRVFRRIIGSWMRNWAAQDENQLVPLMGEEHLSQPYEFRSECVDPILFIADSISGSASLQVGLSAMGADRVRLAWSLAQGSTSTPFGIFELDLSQGAIFSDTVLGVGGSVLAFLPVQTGWSGRTLYVQGVAQTGPGQGQVSRLVSVVVQ